MSDKVRDTGIGSRPVGRVGIPLLAFALSVLAILSVISLVQLWPAPISASAPASVRSTFRFLVWTFSATRDADLILVVVAAGVLGSMAHGLRSVSVYVGGRYLFRSWLLYYFLLPEVGGLAALTVYLVLRAGLLSGASTGTETNPFGFAAVSALVGLFSAEALQKLKGVFETLFTPDPKKTEPIEDVTQRNP